jgi:O-antigen ligase
MKATLLVNIGLLLLFSMALLYTTSTALIGLILTTLGVYSFFSKSQIKFAGAFPDERHVLIALLCMGLVLIALNIYHQERWGMYHLPNATLLCLPIFFALAHTNTNPQYLWSGGSLGALIALAIASYEIVFLNADRAGYIIHNPIPFGSIAMCLAAASVVSYQHKAKAWSPANAWALAGMFAGVAAAVLSGSKGCLLALPVLAYVIHIKCIRPLELPRIWVWLGNFLAQGSVLLISLNTDSFLTNRFEEAFRGALVWFETGHVVEGSVGPRLELIVFALDAAMINPLMGIGRDGMVSMLQSSGIIGAYDPVIAQLHTVHNEFLNIWVAKGLLGLVAMGSVYGLSLWYFWRLRHHAEVHVQNIGLMGLSLCLMYLIFGLSEVALQLTFFRNFFLVTLVCLLGMAHHQLHRTRKSSD